MNGANINGFLVKQQLKSQESALNAKAPIGIRREKMSGRNNMSYDKEDIEGAK